jgi:hypothetical protein
MARWAKGWAARMILPEHAGVANAIGAVVGQVVQRVTGLSPAPSEGRFTRICPKACRFSDRDAALSAMEAGADGAAARARAIRAGAEDVASP